MQHVGKYQLVDKLATGGMAEVFLAKASGPMGFEKTLVLKRILPELATEPAFVEMFLAEAKLVAQLTHPNIVQLFDFGESEGSYFLAMEYIDGPSLRTLIKRASDQGLSLPDTVCARLVSHACEGLAFAHDFADPNTGEPLGIIHRDVSPDNILLSRQGAVKVTDFGIARFAGKNHKTESGIVKGKLPYMPPEQLRAKPLDRRADVYALGVVLYELLTGQRPYASESEAGLMQAILFEAPVPAAQLRPELPQPLRRILSKALSKDRDHRYPDCHAFQAELEEFIVSVGKPVMTQQVAHLINRATTDPGLTLSTFTATPSTATPSPSASPDAARTANLRAPLVSREQGSGLLFTPPPRPAEPEPTLQLRPSSLSQPQPGEPRTSSRWLPALVGGALIALGGGVVVCEWDPVVCPWPTDAGEDPQSDGGPKPPTTDAGTTNPTTVPLSCPEPSPSERGRDMGTIEMRIQPYATVFVDGKKVGEAPDLTLKLPVGCHILKYVNKKLHRTEEQQINIKAGLNEPFRRNLLDE